MRFLRPITAGAAVLALTAAIAAPTLAHAADKYKIFLSMSYSGNDWQTEAQNMVEAMAKAHSDKVELKTQNSGTEVQRQIQQINAMVQAGANAIIVYPISPTALNPAIKAACAKHVVVVAYDSKVTEPCAYNVFTDQKKLATDSAEWVANKMNHKGNLIFITGVPGTTVDTERNDAAHEVFKKYPDIKIVGEPNGMWSAAVARKALTETMSTRKWTDINGVWGGAACYVSWSMEREAGIGADKLVPCGSEGTNGMRVAMLKSGTSTTGKGDYAPAGAPGISIESHPGAGALALKLALKVLAGETVPKTTVMPLAVVTPDTVKLCKTGSWTEMKDGCNTFDPSLVPPGWFANIYSPDTPEIGLNAALKREPEPK
ncbi:sugar ABC transporter substrate-binding protein [Caballeronia novacaledonica]|uniref:ABC transporter substrate-binding protein n=1 Tax=Caballeronia novacaledonica TaxID=1544861 RepID=A0AA37IC76_9BURK|nr:sugar ABC transporter substrate-binding protein [Caballeronia novacaledonica]GJH27002.1 ABC transporter substrate-binding protein [Caballeronia novacaledonica]